MAFTPRQGGRGRTAHDYIYTIRQCDDAGGLYAPVTATLRGSKTSNLVKCDDAGGFYTQGAHSRWDICMLDMRNFDSRSTLDAPKMRLSAKKPKKEAFLKVARVDSSPTLDVLLKLSSNCICMSHRECAP